MGRGKNSIPGGSPLLQRARAAQRSGSTGQRFRIPRKGRIRLVLVALALLVAWQVWQRSRPDTGAKSLDATAAADSRSVPAATDADSTSPSPMVAARRKPAPSKPSPSRRAKKEKSGSSTMSFEEVAALMRGRTPAFNALHENVKVKGRSLRLHYSVDTAMQSYGRRLLRRYHPKYGAIALLETATGRVLSLISYVNEGEPFLGSDLYCSSYFPAASVFKIVTAAGALEKGRLTPASQMRQVGRNHTLYSFQLEPALENYRTIPLSKAFAYSINPVFGRIGIYVLGKEGLREYAARFGFEQSIPFELPVDTSTVGPFDSSFAQAEVASGFNQQTTISPLFGALMASAASEGGRIPRPYVVDSITEPRKERVVYAAQSRLWKIAVRASTAAHLADMMQDVVRFGTARKSFKNVKKSYRFRNLSYGGKTGSVDKDGIGRVDWFVGFARDDADKRKRVSIGVVTVHGPYWTVHSSYVAAEMLRTYMRVIEERDKREKTAMTQNVSGAKSDG